MRLIAAILALAVLAPAMPVRAQDPTPAAPPGQLRLFLDCRTYCDAEFVRAQMRFVDHVRDAREADVHALVTTQATGAGGTAYTMRLIGRGSFQGMDDEIVYALEPGTTGDAVRRSLYSHLALGLARYLARTPTADRIQVSAVTGAGAAVPPRKDAWDNWVFRLSANGYLSGEHRQSYLDGWSSASASRITEEWKTQIGINASYSENTFDIGDGSSVLSTSRNYGASALVVRSLGPRWGVGGTVGTNSDSYSNRRIGFSAAPAIEYNVFPYSESTRRQLTMRYGIGWGIVRYDETTIYDRDTEALPTHALRAQIDTKQPWGSTSLALSGSQYLNHLRQYQLGGSGNFEVRLARGLSLQAYGNVTLLRNQRALPRGDATPEEILLRRRELDTSYRYWSSFGLSYSFGSMLNNVVNSRFPSPSFLFAQF